MKTELSLWILLIVLMTALGYSVGNQLGYSNGYFEGYDNNPIIGSLDETKKQMDILMSRIYMQDIELDDLITTGYYSSNGFYCILTKERTSEEIASTKSHEECHLHIQRDYKHFCNVSGVLRSWKE